MRCRGRREVRGFVRCRGRREDELLIISDGNSFNHINNKYVYI